MAAAILGSFFVFEVAMVLAMGHWWNSESAFFAAGAGLVGFCWLFAFATDSVQLRRLVDGAQAERFTAEQIRRMRAGGWRGVDHVEFHGYDVDHVVAGPGGVLAIETKWTTESWDIADGRFENTWAMKAVDQCSQSADKIHSLLKGNAGIQVAVAPVLVVWGPGRPKITTATMVNGVLVVQGPKLRAALAAMTPCLDTTLRDCVIDAVEHFVMARDRHDRIQRTPKPGVANASRRTTSASARG